jgi:hypothetical protein
VLLSDGGRRHRLPSVTAVSQGHDPSFAHREYRVVAIVSPPQTVRIDSRSPHHDHHPIAMCGHLLQLRLQATLSLALEGGLELVATVADLRLWVLEAGIEVPPLQVRIDELIVATSPREYASYALRIRSTFSFDIGSSPLVALRLVRGPKPPEERRRSWGRRSTVGTASTSGRFERPVAGEASRPNPLTG